MSNHSAGKPGAVANRTAGVSVFDTDLAELLGTPPVLATENRDAYDALNDRVRRAVMPTDVIEEIWSRDVVDLQWEILRLRRLKTKFIATHARRSVYNVLDRLGWTEISELL